MTDLFLYGINKYYFWNSAQQLRKVCAYVYGDQKVADEYDGIILKRHFVKPETSAERLPHLTPRDQYIALRNFCVVEASLLRPVPPGHTHFGRSSGGSSDQSRALHSLCVTGGK